MGNNVRKMTRLWGTWNATLRSISLFCRQTGAMEGFCREEREIQPELVSSPNGIYLMSFLNGLFKPLRSIAEFLFALLSYFNVRSLVVLLPYIKPRDCLLFVCFAT